MTHNNLTKKKLLFFNYSMSINIRNYNIKYMIKASKAGFLFRTTDKIKGDFPELKAFETYDELFNAISEHLN